VTILTDQGPVQGETANISATGTFVKCKGKFRKGEVYWMLIGFDSQAAMINAKALWLDRRQGGETGEARGVGLRFET